MRPLKDLVKPRDSVFDVQRRDTVLDLTDLAGGRIKSDEFFAENYVTEGMHTLLEQAFRRLEGKSDQGVFLLKQAMGGGKTHNLLTLGLLARHPEVREEVLRDIYLPDAALGQVDVVAFSGRESDAPLGIWGSIAEQLGQRDLFNPYYSPLQAPGQNAWEKLLGGRTVLILLDELPPYFDNAESHAIGSSNLARVTATALSNLLVAVGKEACTRVCLVMTDLSGGSYQFASQTVQGVLNDVERETQRSAMPLTPVRMNTDELYHILRTRLFEALPSDGDINDIAQGYAKAMRQAGQMGLVSDSPEQFAERIRTAYPFHPGIRDLYARFRENPGFQQTRGLIRLMRTVVASMWSEDRAKERLLIGAHDLNLNDGATLTEVAAINPTLGNAIAHDVASGGNAVAEKLDIDLESSDASDAAKLLLMSSLANVPNAVQGLAIPEVTAMLCAPGRDISKLANEALKRLATLAWYLHSNRDGKLFFKNVENLNAKLESLVKTYNPEQAKRELRERLLALFKPDTGWCYQEVLPLPALDDIDLKQDKVTLVITEPHDGGLHPDLLSFFKQVTFQNRVAFLTGTKNTYAALLDTGKRLKAAQHILDELKKERAADADPQMQQGSDLLDKYQQNFYSAVRETFTVLHFPSPDGPNGLMKADLFMKFDGNKYSGEGQILEVLKQKAKFTDDISGETFRKKCEQRLFTQQALPWGEIKKRAATNTRWQWHKPDALDSLKAECLHKDIWREQGGYVDKGPFPQPETSVSVNLQSRDPDTGECVLRVTPVHGEEVYWEVGARPTTASAKLEGNTLKTSELELHFIAVDPGGVHETGEPVVWRNEITLKHRIYDASGGKRMELKAAPPAEIRYTTDGSSPKTAGALYESDFDLPAGTSFVLAHACRGGVESQVEKFAVRWDGAAKLEVDAAKPATWTRSHAFKSTKDSYEFLERLKKHQAKAVGLDIYISSSASDQDWVDLRVADGKAVEAALVEEVLEAVRKLQGNGQVELTAGSVLFESGQGLLNWAEEVKTQLVVGEVKQ